MEILFGDIVCLVQCFFTCCWGVFSLCDWWFSLDQIYVFFPEEQKVGVKTMKTYTNRMKSENVFRAILVVQQSLTPFAKACISEISTKFHLEVFQVNYWCFSDSSSTTNWFIRQENDVSPSFCWPILCLLLTCLATPW